MIVSIAQDKSVLKDGMEMVRFSQTISSMRKGKQFYKRTKLNDFKKKSSCVRHFGRTTIRVSRYPNKPIREDAASNDRACHDLHHATFLVHVGNLLLEGLIAETDVAGTVFPPSHCEYGDVGGIGNALPSHCCFH